MLKLAWTAITGALGGIQTYLIVGAVCLAVGAAGTWRVMSWREGSHANDQSKAVVRLVDNQIVINMSIGDVVIRGITIVHDEAERRLTEIPQHVTPEIDRAFPVPLGFVRMWNDASHGPIPGPTSGGDADPSGIPLSDVARAHSGDAETLDSCRVYLTGWWAWYDKQSAAWNTTNHLKTYPTVGDSP